MEDLLAKTKPRRTLREHTDHVVEQARILLDAQPHIVWEYDRRTGASLEASLLRAAHIHDWGKSHPTWQGACQKDADDPSGRHLMKAGLRHEFASLDYAKQAGMSLSTPERVAIAAHHGKLSVRYQHRWAEDDEGRFKPFWNDFRDTHLQSFLESNGRFTPSILERRYRLAGLRSLLRLADTRASRMEGGGWIPGPERFQFDYAFPYTNDDGSPSFRGVQHVANRHANESRLILRAPTGSGKTDSALLWAKAQIDAGRADRCVIAMPTRFTSNALAIGVNDSVSDTGLYHSSAWHSSFYGENEDEEGDSGAKEGRDRERDEAEEMHRMARLLMTPLTVCTVDHLLMGLTGMREDHHAVFFNLMHACVVFDEADFYDPFVQSNIQVLLRVLREFDVPVLVMSATVPDAATSLYGIDTLAEDTSDLDRPRCDVVVGGAVENPDEDLGPLMDEVADAPAAIVYANTVKRALRYYDAICDRGRTPVLYHSRFTEPDKKQIEGKLVNALGREAWETETASGIAILTQIGEMSLNISAPLMVSELCPWDRLAQRAGRLSRFEDMPYGTLHVVTPVQGDALYPAPYGSYDLDSGEWTVGEPLRKTQDTMRAGPISAQDFIDFVEVLYPDVESFSPSTAKSTWNRKKLEEHLGTNWLILPKAESNDDEGTAKEWRSRDIPPQGVVLTRCPHDFQSYADYQAFELSNSVSCPAYQISKGEKLGRVKKVAFQVGDEKEEAYYSTVYSSTEGLILDDDRDRSVRDRCL